MLTLDQFQEEHYAWMQKNFGEQKPRIYALGVMEELGELAHAQRCMELGIRGTLEELVAKKKDAIADCIIYLFGYCSLMRGEASMSSLLGYEKDARFSDVQDVARVLATRTAHWCEERVDLEVVPLLENTEDAGWDALRSMDISVLFFHLAYQCVQNNWSLETLMEDTWKEVKRRDWKQFPQDGRGA